VVRARTVDLFASAARHVPCSAREVPGTCQAPGSRLHKARGRLGLHTPLTVARHVPCRCLALHGTCRAAGVE
jgi:hypothetical protein